MTPDCTSCATRGAIGGKLAATHPSTLMLRWQRTFVAHSAASLSAAKDSIGSTPSGTAGTP